jgi:hypothetical protein
MELKMATVRLDEEGEHLSAYQRLQPFIGIADSGGQQLSQGTGKRLRELLAGTEGALGVDRDGHDQASRSR